MNRPHAHLRPMRTAAPDEHTSGSGRPGGTPPTRPGPQEHAHSRPLPVMEPCAGGTAGNEDAHQTFPITRGRGTE